jgi:hypothetical protein
MTRQEMRRIREWLVEWFEEMTRDLPPPERWLDVALDRSDDDQMPSSTRRTSSASGAVGRNARYVL